MRIVRNEDEFEKAWDDARQESRAAFGNDGLYLEKFIEEPRHIEIQIVGDQYGKAVTFLNATVLFSAVTRN